VVFTAAAAAAAVETAEAAVAALGCHLLRFRRGEKKGSAHITM